MRKFVASQWSQTLTKCNAVENGLSRRHRPSLDPHIVRCSLQQSGYVIDTTAVSSSGYQSVQEPHSIQWYGVCRVAKAKGSRTCFCWIPGLLLRIQLQHNRRIVTEYHTVARQASKHTAMLFIRGVTLVTVSCPEYKSVSLGFASAPFGR